ncbi:hypothetical protein Bca101_017442 [Brassica carinata]
MFVRSVIGGSWGLKGLWILRLRGAKKEAEHQPTDGFGEYQKGRQIFFGEIWADLNEIRNNGQSSVFLERGDMVNRRDSMGSEDSQFRGWNSMDTFKELNPFDPVAKERTESRSCGDICRILFQRKRAFWKEKEYKKAEVSRTQSITISNTFLFLILLVNGFWLFCLFIMTQSQLIGKPESKKTAANVIKKLKISVPHFDNSELIKGYSRTLIGRCMNPSKQDVKLLISMLPKIWKVEDRVVGADLGLGRFQFDFEQEADIEECPLSTEAPEKKLESQEDSDVKHGERVASYKGVVINGNDREKYQENDRKDHQGKGKGKMYAEEDSKWVNVSEKRLGKNISSRGRYRGEERDSSFRSSFQGRARFAPQEERFSDSSSQGVRRERERSPRENFHYRERSTSRRSGTGRNERHEQTEQTNRLDHKEKEGSLGIRSTNAAEKKETNVELLPAEDSLDLANEVLEAMNLKEGVEGMEVDGEVVSEGGVQKTADAEDGFQDLTDEEGEVKGDGVIDSVTGGEPAGDKESKEEGESENGVVEGEMVKKQSTKKKAVKSGTVVAGCTTKKRMVQAMMLQGKRTAAKNSSNPDEGSKKMEEKGSLNPKPSSMK